MTDNTQALVPTRDYAFRVRVEYRTGQAFEVEALNLEDLLDVINVAVKTVWPQTDKALTLDEMKRWLGWE